MASSWAGEAAAAAVAAVGEEDASPFERTGQRAVVHRGVLLVEAEVAAAAASWEKGRAGPSLEEGEAQEGEEHHQWGLDAREQRGEGGGVGAREHQGGKEEGEHGEGH